MKQCINCLSNNISTAIIKNRIFYYCKNCEFKSERIINNDGDIYTRKENGMIKHITVAAIIRKENEILVMQRKKYPYGLSVITGHLLNSESVERTLSRTVLAKTGLTVLKKRLLLNDTIPDACKYWGEIHEWFTYECTVSGTINSSEDTVLWYPIDKLANSDLIESSKIILSRLNIIKETAPEKGELSNNPYYHPDEKNSGLGSESIICDLPIPVITTDTKGRIILKNISAEKIIDKIFKDTETSEKFNQVIPHLVTRSITQNFSVSSNIKTKTEVFNLVVRPLYTHGKISGSSIILTNVTDQKQREARDVLAYRTSLAICSNSNYLNIIRTVLKQMFFSMDIVGSSLMTLTEDRLRVTFRYSKVDHKKRLPRELKLGEGVAGWVAKNKTILAVPDTSKDEMYIGSAIKEEKSILSVPVMYNQEVFGVLNITKHTNDYFSEEEIKMVETVANRIALAFENDRLYRQLNQEKNILEQVLTNSTDGIALVDKNLNVHISNTFLKKLHKIPDNKPLKTLSQIKKNINEEDYKKLIRAIEVSIKERKTNILIISNSVDKLQYIKTTISPFIESKNHCDKVLLVKNDITEQISKQRVIEKQIKQISALYKISSILNATSIKSNLLEKQSAPMKKIIDMISNILDAKAGIYIPDNESLLIKKEDRGTIEEILLKKEIKNGYISNNIGKELKIKTSVNKIMLTPLKEGSTIYGILYAKDKSGIFTKEEFNWLRAIATRVALKVKSQKLLLNVQYEGEQLAKILDNTADGIVVARYTENNLTQLIWNKAMSKITGFGGLDDFFEHNPEQKAKYKNVLSELNGDLSFIDNINYESELKTKDGKIKWFGLKISPFKFQNEIYLIVLIHDISQRKKMEIQQKEFVYTATHELRTPLTIINGYLSMILSGDAGTISNKQETYFKRVKIATERIIRLVEELLKVARLEEERVEFDKKPFDAIKVIEEIYEEFINKAKAKKLDFVINSKIFSDKKMLLGDFNKTKEAMSNIVDNAIKYTTRGKVTINFIENENNGIFVISDTGVGISSEDQENIFKKFIRVSNSESVKAGGTGLGLYIVKNIIEQQGGKIYLKSKIGEGSSFYIELPKLKRLAYEK